MATEFGSGLMSWSGVVGGRCLHGTYVMAGGWVEGRRLAVQVLCRAQVLWVHTGAPAYLECGTVSWRDSCGVSELGGRPLAKGVIEGYWFAGMTVTVAVQARRHACQPHVASRTDVSGVACLCVLEKYEACNACGRLLAVNTLETSMVMQAGPQAGGAAHGAQGYGIWAVVAQRDVCLLTRLRVVKIIATSCLALACTAYPSFTCCVLGLAGTCCCHCCAAGWLGECRAVT